MKRIYLLAAALILSVTVNAQNPAWLWAKLMGAAGSDAGNAITTDAQGNVYTTGAFVGTVDFNPGAGVFNLTSTDSLITEIFVSKTDSNGNFVWAIALGGADVEVARGIAYDPTGSGAIYITGNFTGTADFDPSAGVHNLTSVSPGSSDIFICKLDLVGNSAWAKSMGGTDIDAAYSIAFDPAGSGDVYITGSFKGTANFDPNGGTVNLFSAGSNDIFVAKYSSAGNLIWAKAMGGPTADWGLGIALSQGGSTAIYTCGYFSGTGDFDPGVATHNMTSAGFDDIFISKLDASGNFLWAKAIGGTDGDYANAIASDMAGSVYTTGRFRLTADFDPGAGAHNLTSLGTDDIFISKLDSAGNFAWANRIGGAQYDNGTSIVADGTGHVYTIGGFNGAIDFDPGAGVTVLTSAGNIDIYVASFDTAGNFAWAKQAGGTNGDNIRGLAIAASGSLYATGSYSSTSIIFNQDTITTIGQSDVFIVKIGAVPTGVDTHAGLQLPVSIYPNPFTDELTVSSLEQGELKVFDMYGRLVYTQKLSTGNAPLSTTNWKPGIYLIELVTDNCRMEKKVVKH